MASVTVAEHIRAPAAKIWAVAGRFGEIHDWVPAIAGTKANGIDVGSERTLSLNDGGTIREEMVGRTEEPAAYTYTILESPLPVDNHISTLMVVPDGEEECTVSWVCSFMPNGATEDEAKGILSGIYKAGLAELRRRFEP